MTRPGRIIFYGASLTALLVSFNLLPASWPRHALLLAGLVLVVFSTFIGAMVAAAFDLLREWRGRERRPW